MKTFPIISISIICCLFYSIQAYCVYNKSAEKEIAFRQDKFNTNSLEEALFKTGLMAPGSKQCCPYTNNDCSKSRDKGELLIMEIYYSMSYWHRITFPAGGWIEVTDDPNNPEDVTVSVFNADGSPFKPAYLDHL